MEIWRQIFTTNKCLFEHFARLNISILQGYATVGFDCLAQNYICFLYTEVLYSK